MSNELETTRAVRSWLEDGVTVLPDRVLDAVLDELPATHQRRSWWPAWRFDHMSNPIRLAIGAAAVLAVVVVGYQFLPGSGGPGGVGPSASPTATPEPTQVPRPPESGLIPAGDYLVGSGPDFVFTLPAGWQRVSAGGIRKHLDEPTEVAILVHPLNLRVNADACASEGTSQEIGLTADDFIEGLLAQENADWSTPVDDALGEIPVQRLEVRVPAGLDTSQCTIGSLQMWFDATESIFLAGDPDPVATVYVADTAAGRLVITYSEGEDSSAADIAELQSVLESIRLP